MDISEKILASLSEAELQAALESLVDNDYYLKDFESNVTLYYFMNMLLSYNLVYVSSAEKRVLLTPRGENTLQHLNQKLI